MAALRAGITLEVVDSKDNIDKYHEIASLLLPNDPVEKSRFAHIIRNHILPKVGNLRDLLQMHRTTLCKPNKDGSPANLERYLGHEKMNKETVYPSVEESVFKSPQFLQNARKTRVLGMFGDDDVYPLSTKNNFFGLIPQTQRESQFLSLLSTFHNNTLWTRTAVLIGYFVFMETDKLTVAFNIGYSGRNTALRESFMHWVMPAEALQMDTLDFSSNVQVLCRLTELMHHVHPSGVDSVMFVLPFDAEGLMQVRCLLFVCFELLSDSIVCTQSILEHQAYSANLSMFLCMTQGERKHDADAYVYGQLPEEDHDIQGYTEKLEMLSSEHWSELDKVLMLHQDRMLDHWCLSHITRQLQTTLRNALERGGSPVNVPDGVSVAFNGKPVWYICTNIRHDTSIRTRYSPRDNPPSYQFSAWRTQCLVNGADKDVWVSILFSLLLRKKQTISATVQDFGAVMGISRNWQLSLRNLQRSPDVFTLEHWRKCVRPELLKHEMPHGKDADRRLAYQEFISINKLHHLQLKAPEYKWHLGVMAAQEGDAELAEMVRQYGDFKEFTKWMMPIGRNFKFDLLFEASGAQSVQSFRDIIAKYRVEHFGEHCWQWFATATGLCVQKADEWLAFEQ